MAREIERDAGKLETDVRKLEFKRMFRGEMDSHNAFLDIQAGAGGTEAQDWAQMLLRMYLKWAASRGFEAEVFDSQAGEVAGIKSATIEIKGEYAYGWLRTETGVHRLVRKSPFDSGNRATPRSHRCSSRRGRRRHQDRSQSRRHQDGRVPLERRRRPARQQDGIGGAPDAEPSGIVVACQNERSQHKNRATAMKMLKAKLYELEVNKRNAASKVLEDSKRRRLVGQPDPFLRARSVAYQGSAHRRRNR
jgi:peptide chain release factor 2